MNPGNARLLCYTCCFAPLRVLDESIDMTNVAVLERIPVVRLETSLTYRHIIAPDFT